MRDKESEREKKTNFNSFNDPMQHGQHIWPTLLTSYTLQMTLGNTICKRIIHDRIQNHWNLIFPLLNLSTPFMTIQTPTRIKATDQKLENGSKLNSSWLQELFLVDGEEVWTDAGKRSSG